MIQIIDKEKCCGCTACVSICPKKCISMKSDDEGFLYPYVTTSECVNCGACEKTCPMENKNGVERHTSIILGAQVKDSQKRLKCTAGGIVSIIAEQMYQNGVNVFGCLYSNMKPCHKRAISIRDIEAFRGSKYVQSNMENTISEIRKLIKSGEKVLFIGTPCQVHGLKNVVGDNDNLITIDLLCLGVSSPGLFSKWISYIEKKYKCKVKEVQFRNKKYGYSMSNVQIVLSNGRIIEQKYDSKAYIKTFFNYYYNVRPSCYSCDFRESPRVSDITVGDFSNIGEYSHEFDDDIGTTQVWLHSPKAIEILRSIKHNIRIIEIQRDASNLFGGPKKQIIRPNNREVFFSDAKTNDFNTFIQKWCPASARDLVATFIIKLIDVLPMKKAIRNAIRKRKTKNFHKTVTRVNSSMRED